MLRTTRATLSLLIVATIAIPGCVAWHPASVGPVELLRTKAPEVIQVTRADSSKVALFQPRIVNDTLIGHPTEEAIQRLMIPLSDVRGVATQYRHIGKTLLAGLVVIGGVAVYALLQSLNQTSF
jgi:hypothetical protein